MNNESSEGGVAGVAEKVATRQVAQEGIKPLPSKQKQAEGIKPLPSKQQAETQSQPQVQESPEELANRVQAKMRESGVFGKPTQTEVHPGEVKARAAAAQQGWEGVQDTAKQTRRQQEESGGLTQKGLKTEGENLEQERNVRGQMAKQQDTKRY